MMVLFLAMCLPLATAYSPIAGYSRPSSISSRAPSALACQVGRRQAVSEASLIAAVAASGVPLACKAESDYPKLSMQTTEGEMVFELYDDVAPKHVASFLKLTKEGFFDGGAFHRIIPGCERPSAMSAAQTLPSPSPSSSPPP